MVDGEVARADGGEKASEPGVADQRLVAALELPLEALENGRALGGVLRGLLVIAADDVACAVELDRLGFVIDGPAALLDGERHKGLWIREHEVAHQLVRALTAAEDVEEIARLQRRDGLAADHAAIGDDAEPRDGKAPAQPVDDRHEAGDVGRVARPHLRADWTAVTIDYHGQDHLAQVGPVVLAVAVLPERLPAGALEGQAGGVQEHQIEAAEEVAAGGGEGLFHHGPGY